MTPYERIPLESSDMFSNAIELSSAALGGQVITVSDEFFAEAHHLLHVEPAPSLKGQFGPKGALYSGWETRRHNPIHDWCIIKLGTTGSIFGFDIDTSHFNGNEAPEVSVEALYSDDGVPSSDDLKWSEILPRVPLGPNSRHLFKIPVNAGVNYVKLNMYPDGGIARFRIYGFVSPVYPEDKNTPFDLAHVFSGGQVVFISDQHFGAGGNLILPGRGKDMGDGWETKRSRQPGHKDWVVIKLGAAGLLSHVEIDTAHFKGNFPESCEIHAATSSNLVPTDVPEDKWVLVLPRAKLGPHRQQYFPLENVSGVSYTHVRVTIYPDGGIKRIRVIGRRTDAVTPLSSSVAESVTDAAMSSTVPPTISQLSPGSGPVIPALPLTPEAFAPFGQVTQGYSDVNAVPSPRNVWITSANVGTALKFHKLSLLESSYPVGSNATAGLSVYRCQPIDAHPGGLWAVKLLERHVCTNQAFIPMGAGGASGENIREPGTSYLVIVAKNGDDDKPNLKTMRAFVATAAQGIVYNTGIWHHPMAVLERAMDLTCVETQIGNGNALDCEVVDLDSTSGYIQVQIPSSL